MQYRTFGKLDWRVSALGFGTMRLPVVDGDSGQIDEPEATRMLRYAIDHGVNYVDSAYSYHEGNAERFLSRALADGYRRRVKLATKMPTWLVESAGDFDRYLDEQLEKLGTGAIDVYLLHTLNGDRWHKVRDLGVLDWAERAMADGRIGHLGFSFHDNYDAFTEILDGYDRWAMCQIYYNYLSEEFQAGTRGLREAASRGLAVSIMGPIQGGLLSSAPPPIAALWRSVPWVRTPSDWALQWLWNQPEVTVVLSGMNTMAQVEENLASAGNSGPGALSEEELALVSRVRDAYMAMRAVPCSGCRYCQPCPNGVWIDEIFRMYNNALMHGAAEKARLGYASLPQDARADRCLQCGQCEDACPQQIAIIESLARAHQYLQPAA